MWRVFTWMPVITKNEWCWDGYSLCDVQNPCGGWCSTFQPMHEADAMQMLVYRPSRKDTANSLQNGNARFKVVFGHPFTTSKHVWFLHMWYLFEAGFLSSIVTCLKIQCHFGALLRAIIGNLEEDISDMHFPNHVQRKFKRCKWKSLYSKFPGPVSVSSALCFWHHLLSPSKEERDVKSLPSGATLKNKAKQKSHWHSNFSYWHHVKCLKKKKAQVAYFKSSYNPGERGGGREKKSWLQRKPRIPKASVHGYSCKVCTDQSVQLGLERVVHLHHTLKRARK